MIIKNYKSLATTRIKKQALAILEAGLQAANPEKILKKIIKKNTLAVSSKKISLQDYKGVYIVALGKAAAKMAKATCQAREISGGIIVVPENTQPPAFPKKIKVVKSSHPVPTAKSVNAAKKVIDFLQQLNADDFVIFLISGGTSSLVALPNGITLQQKQQITHYLLQSGAKIDEINCVRKHLSKIKGGQLLNYLRCKGVALVISDHAQNDLSVIASGITYHDKSTFKDAKRILKKYKLNPSSKIWDRINQGVQGQIFETPKKSKIKNYIILSNDICLLAMGKKAKSFGYQPKILSGLSSDVRSVAKQILKHTYNDKCIIFGGEPTVFITGNGRGGRNQELVLHCINQYKQKTSLALIASIGTDGIDGCTSAAGAIANTLIPKHAFQNDLSNNNSYHFFKKNGGLILTGPTETNVADIGLIILE